MPTRSAHTTWSGSLQDGSGTVDLASSGVGSYQVSFPGRTADSADGVTSPEELIAAAHSSCYAMQMSAVLGEAGGSNPSVHVTAEVSLAKDPAGGLRIDAIALTVRGSAEGLDPAAFLRAAEEAKATCPVGKALTGTEITLDASSS
jgi:osmotically inducible protein OsmC